MEIPFQADDKPMKGQPLPRQGCNVELTKIQLAEDPRQWRTLGFEAFGDLDSAPRSLQTTAQFLIARSIPLPNSFEFMNYPAWLDKIMTSEMPRRFGRPRRKGHNLSGMIFTPSCYEKLGNKSGSIRSGPERKQDCSQGQVPWRT